MLDRNPVSRNVFWLIHGSISRGISVTVAIKDMNGWLTIGFVWRFCPWPDPWFQYFYYGPDSAWGPAGLNGSNADSENY